MLLEGGDIVGPLALDFFVINYLFVHKSPLDNDVV